MPLKIAIAGAGMIANAGHIPAWKSLPKEAEIIGVYNHNIAKAEKAIDRHGIAKAYDDFDKMIADAKPDILSVCTPNTRHAEFVLKALRAGIHVLCEKPLATTSEEARMLYRIAGEKLLLIFGLHIVDQRFGRIFFHLLGVAHHKPDAEDRADNQQDQTPHQPLANVGPGKAGGDARGEGVDGGS